jgi:hypothetical protein
LYFKADDLFAHFAAPDAVIPSLDQLLKAAHDMSMRYLSERAYENILKGDETAAYPVGSTWTPPVRQDSWTTAGANGARQPGKKKKSAPKKKAHPVTETDTPCAGDLALAQTILFIRDALNNLEMVSAVANCNPGRAWEAMKVSNLLYKGIVSLPQCAGHDVHLCRIDTS